MAIAIATLVSAARAQDVASPPSAAPGSEVAQPEPTYLPPPVYATDVAPVPAQPSRARPPGPNGFERRQRVGIQLGGTGIAQIVYRLRVAGPLHLEAGALGIHGANLSLGALVGAPVANRWLPYVGFGAGLMFGGGPQPACDSTMMACANEKSEALSFLHARAGIGLAFGATRRNLLSLDFGGWYGTHTKSETDSAGRTTDSSETLLLPMAGLSYFFAIH